MKDTNCKCRKTSLSSFSISLAILLYYFSFTLIYSFDWIHLTIYCYSTRHWCSHLLLLLLWHESFVITTTTMLLLMQRMKRPTLWSHADIPCADVCSPDVLSFSQSYSTSGCTTSLHRLHTQSPLHRMSIRLTAPNKQLSERIMFNVLYEFKVVM